MRVITALLTAIGLFPLGFPLGALAQTPHYPNRPIKIVVPFNAGGPMDVLARAIGERLTASMGQPVVVDNRPGANSILGADLVAKSAPDGYTLLMGTDSTYSINPLIYRKLPYQPERDLAPLVVAAHAPEYMMVSAALPVRNMAEFIAYAKAHPGTLSYGSFGTGSNAHLAGEALKDAAGIDMVHVPYKGGAEAIPALIGNQIQVMFMSPGPFLQHIRQGKVRVIGTGWVGRTPLLADVPTYAELGFRNLDVKPWFGLFVPMATPQDIQQKLSDEIDKVVGQPDFQERNLLPLVFVPAPAGRAYFRQLLKDDVERYRRYVRIANVKIE